MDESQNPFAGKLKISVGGEGMNISDLLCLIDEKKPIEKAKWRDIPNSIILDTPGVYIVSLDFLTAEPELSDVLIEGWINLATNMRIDGQTPTIQKIRDRLSSFWIPDETILYIGQTTGQTLRRRITQFYNHTVGCSRPHRGGQWLHTLADLGDLNVHWCTVNNPIEAEQKMLKCFMDNVSKESRNRLFDPDTPLPFANLEYQTPGHRCRKNHQIKHQTVV